MVRHGSIIPSCIYLNINVNPEVPLDGLTKGKVPMEEMPKNWFDESGTPLGPWLRLQAEGCGSTPNVLSYLPRTRILMREFVVLGRGYDKMLI